VVWFQLKGYHLAQKTVKNLSKDVDPIFLQVQESFRKLIIDILANCFWKVVYHILHNILIQIILGMK
jgi:hypothetical protein